MWQLRTFVLVGAWLVLLGGTIASWCVYLIPVMTRTYSVDKYTFYLDPENCVLPRCLISIDDGKYLRMLKGTCPDFINSECYIHGLWKNDDKDIPDVIDTECTPKTTTTGSTGRVVVMKKRSSSTSSSSSSKKSDSDCECSRKLSKVVRRGETSEYSSATRALFWNSPENDLIVVGNCKCDGNGETILFQQNPNSTPQFRVSTIVFGVATGVFSIITIFAGIWLCS